ncbi:MAG: YdiU family protein [Croceivirga sp.]
MELEHTYGDLPSVFFTLQKPEPVPNPGKIYFNTALANQLGLGFLNNDEKKIIDYFSGNKVPKTLKPLAQAYAGHQFGHFTMLGDGRAVLLGEQIDPSGQRFDIQLKGSGQTPYSRRGDGRATLYSMLREYIISEAMHHLGIATTRSLSVIATGQSVFRGTMHEGAVLSRVAKSHIRVGTFEYARHFCSIEDLQALTNYTIKRHFPDIINSENPPLELLKSVMQKQIDLVVDWMRVGFIHGVMNTDNMSIAGETIDYGPCAFMNSYDRKTVFSSIDKSGRYAFGNQSDIVRWNLIVFANALLPLVSKNKEKAVAMAQEVIDAFQQEFTQKWYAMMFDKLGIMNVEEKDKDLVDELLVLMETQKADYTQVFLALQQERDLDITLFRQKTFDDWKLKWKKTHQRGEERTFRLERMQQSNPKVIPRNHWVENALEAAVDGDMKPLNHLLERLSKPYGHHLDEIQFEQIPISFDAEYQTFCGT